MANELHTMPLKVERLLSSANVQSLELDEFGAYMKLLCHAWLNKGVLPEFCLSSAKATSKLLGCEMEDIPRIKEKVIDSFFVLGEDGKARNETLSKIYSDVSIYSNERKSSGRKGGTSRANNEKQLKLSLSSGQAKLKDSLSIQSQSQSISSAIATEIHHDDDAREEPSHRNGFGIVFNQTTWEYDYIHPATLESFKRKFPGLNIGSEMNRAADYIKSKGSLPAKTHYEFLSVTWLPNALIRMNEKKGG